MTQIVITDEMVEKAEAAFGKEWAVSTGIRAALEAAAPFFVEQCAKICEGIAEGEDRLLGNRYVVGLECGDAIRSLIPTQETK